MQRWAQHRLLAQRATRGMQKPGQWVPRFAKRYALALSGGVLLVEHRPYRGYCALALHRTDPDGTVNVVNFPGVESKAMKRRSLGLGADAPLPALSGESVVLKRFPRLCEFLTAVYYDDGSPRVPGTVWLKVDGIAFVLTLLDPDACARLNVRAASLDDVLTLTEKLLGSDGAAWELDRYAAEKAAQKKKKK